MLSAVTNASRFAWSDWFLGIMRSIISGGAGAVSSAFSVSFIDPKDWNFSSEPGHMLELMGWTFLFTALIHMAAYLQSHPVPDAIANGNSPPKV